MSRTITALFDTRADADAGRERLLAANIDADNVRIHDQASRGAAADATTSSQLGGSDTGLWGAIKNAFMPDDDRQTYEESIRRGGFVLSADVDEDEIEEAIRVLEESNGVDIDERSQSWRSEGWTASIATAENKPAIFGNDRSTDEDSIGMVEERLVVGKREIERGGMKVRSYVTEAPAHEQVRLRDETVDVQRRPIDRDVASMDGNVFRERSMSTFETAEVAVIGKTARVVEEVSLGNTAHEHVEDINEPVRKTDVEIDDMSGVDRTVARDADSSDLGLDDDAAGGGDGAIGIGKPTDRNY